MYNTVAVLEDLFYVGASDRRLSLFENVYPVPRGASYNSYLLLDEKTALFDTVDHAVSEQFLENVEHVLGGRELDYIVVHHMEPDHSSTLSEVLLRHPEATVVCNQKIDGMLKNYGCCVGERLLVKEGDELSTGRHTFKFVFAPMVHWPEVMMSFDLKTGALFSADAFGTFGALGGSVWADEVDFEHDFLDDARRYYINIVGKYGVQVQSVLKKAAGLDIKYLLPLHGPLWRENIGRFVEKYLTWSSYTPEEKGVLVVYGSIYGHTQNAAEIVASRIAQKGVKVKVYDASMTDTSVLVSEAFRYSHIVFASATYNNGIFVKMEEFLSDLKAHAFQNRAYAVVENGSWAPQAGALIEAELSSFKNMKKLGEKVTILSSVKEETREQLLALADLIAGDVKA